MCWRARCVRHVCIQLNQSIRDVTCPHGVLLPGTAGGGPRRRRPRRLLARCDSVASAPSLPVSVLVSVLCHGLPRHEPVACMRVGSYAPRWSRACVFVCACRAATAGLPAKLVEGSTGGAVLFAGKEGAAYLLRTTPPFHVLVSCVCVCACVCVCVCACVCVADRVK